MNRKILLILLIITFAGWQQTLSAQDLNTLLENRMGHIEDITQIDTAIKNAMAMAEEQPDSAIHALHESFKMSRALHYNYGMASSLLSTGTIYVINKSEPQQGLFYLRKAYFYCIVVTKQKERLMAIWSNCMAAAFHVQGSYDSAMIYYYKAITEGESYDWAGMEDIAVKVYNNMAALQTDMQQREKEAYYLRKAEEIALKGHFTEDLAQAYIGFAGIYSLSNRFDSAAFYLRKIRHLNIPQDKGLAAGVNTSYAVFYLMQHQPQKAIPYLNAALETRQNSAKNLREKINTLNTIAGAYFSLKEYRRSEQYLERAYNLATKVGIQDSRLAIIFNNLAEVCDSIGDYKKAYRYKARYAALQDTLNNKEKVKISNQLETRYRTSEKDKALARKELLLVKAQNDLNKRNLWTVSIAALLLIVILLLIQRARVKAQREKLERSKVLMTGEENERARIGRQLHDDVMVAFSIVKMNLAALLEHQPPAEQIEDYKNIVRQLDLAGIKLRQTAHNLMPDALLEEGLIPAIHYFCTGIQQTSGLRINFQHYGDLPRLPANTEIGIYRMIQELIQNVIKHASATKVLVQLNYREHYLSVMIEDNGKGIRDIAPSNGGMGLKSIRTRLKVLNGDLEITNIKPHGTSVHIQLTLGNGPFVFTK